MRFEGPQKVAFVGGPEHGKYRCVPEIRPFYEVALMPQSHMDFAAIDANVLMDIPPIQSRTYRWDYMRDAYIYIPDERDDDPPEL